MFTFLTALVELLGILLKSLIKSCVPKHGKKEKDASVQGHSQNTECSGPPEREGSTVPKKHRRASITQKTVQTTETTTIYELSGSGSSSGLTPALIENVPNSPQSQDSRSHSPSTRHKKRVVEEVE